MAEPNSWLRISLEVDPELAEAVAEVLARHIPGGIVMESTAIEADAEDEGRAVGPWRVMGYIPIDEQLEERRSQIEQGLRYLAMIQPLPEPQYENILEQNWMEAWKKHYKPTQIGERLMIVPAWMDIDTQNRIPIRIEPGMAFGTGVHPTTQLCLQLVEKAVRPGASVIDVGSGSGILAIAAAKLGATQIVAVDIDNITLENARLNAQLNGVDFEIGEGSVAELLAGNYSLQKADVVIANILAPVLIRLLHNGLKDLMNPGATLILSGILADQETDMLAALKKASLTLIDQRRHLDWLALAAQ
jgi:ribosomal protein L11 methyltransferase